MADVSLDHQVIRIGKLGVRSKSALKCTFELIVGCASRAQMGRVASERIRVDPRSGIATPEAVARASKRPFFGATTRDSQYTLRFVGALSIPPFFKHTLLKQ
jgi:hypothetical protein